MFPQLLHHGHPWPGWLRHPLPGGLNSRLKDCTVRLVKGIFEGSPLGLKIWCECISGLSDTCISFPGWKSFLIATMIPRSKKNELLSFKFFSPLLRFCRGRIVFGRVSLLFFLFFWDNHCNYARSGFGVMISDFLSNPSIEISTCFVLLMCQYQKSFVTIQWWNWK